jgi:ABC-type dipeptide/oligopeptide/nickel transport system permease subunit
MSPLEPFLHTPRVAYFSMEVAVRPEMHSYAGGLGVLAGDTARSCADLELPVVFVTLVSRAGYFRQTIDDAGRQVEEPDRWQPAAWCTPLDAMIAIAIVYQPHFARLTRAAVMGEKNREYVVAARVAGASRLRLMFRTILPNCLAPLIVQATLSFSSAVLDAAALGFLGMGAQPPASEWGTMLAEAREFILRAWWVVTFPGLAILISVLAINLMGDGLSDALDPKLKRS